MWECILLEKDHTLCVLMYPSRQPPFYNKSIAFNCCLTVGSDIDNNPTICEYLNPLFKLLLYLLSHQQIIAQLKFIDKKS